MSPKLGRRGGEKGEEGEEEGKEGRGKGEGNLVSPAGYVCAALCAEDGARAWPVALAPSVASLASDCTAAGVMSSEQALSLVRC